MENAMFDTARLIDFEKEYGLFQRSVGKVFYWEYIRFDIQLMLGEAEGSSNNVASPKTSKKKILLAVIKKLSKDIVLCKEKKDVWVLNHPRKVRNSDGKLMCMYTDTFIEDLGYSYVNVEELSLNDAIEEADNQNRYYDAFPWLLAKVRKILLSKNVKSEIMKEANWLASTIEAVFDRYRAWHPQFFMPNKDFLRQRQRQRHFPLLIYPYWNVNDIR